MVVLVAPNVALETGNQSSPPLPHAPVSHYALEAPRSPILTFEEYAALAAKDTGMDGKKFTELIRCESRWDEEAKGDNGTSHGILQFKEATFDLFAKKYGLESADIENSYHQINLAALMLRDGYIAHWKNCSRQIGWIK